MPNETLTAATAPVVASIEANLPPASVTGGSWYVINAAKDNSEAEISIYDAIGAWGVSAQQFVGDLKAIKASKINLRLNTPGGEVFDGTAIYNALREHPAQIIVHVDGVAASAGSFIAMSGDKVRMADNAYLMIHNARGGVMGEADDMRRYADVLEKINGNIAAMYIRKAGNTADHWRGLMDAETWFTADEAKQQGLVDEVYTATKQAAGVKAAFDFKIYNKIPDAVRGMWGINNNTQSAPDESQRSDPPTPQVAQLKGNSMSDTTTAAPAQNQAGTEQVTEPTVAQLRQMTAEGHFKQGHTKGIADGHIQAVERLKAIIAVCPGKPQMVIDCFLTGQSPESSKLAFDAGARAEAEAKRVQDEKDREIARLNALLATGGHSGVEIDFAATNDEQESVLDPKAQAEREWDFKPAVRKGFSTKDRYVAFRVRELNGTVQRQLAQ